MKNAELEALLKERSLPHAGKKADMVARLTDHDKSSGKSSADAQPKATSMTTATGVTTTASSDQAAAAVAAGGISRADNPLSVPNQIQAEDPVKTSDLSVSKDNTTSASTAATSTTTPPVTSTTGGAADAPPVPAAPAFTANLAQTDLDAEIEKRKARAKKFGIVEDNVEATKALERAKKFGTGTAGEQSGGAVVKGLDQALPERTERKRGRGAEQGRDDASKRQRGGRGGRGRPDERPRGPRREPSGAKITGTGSSWMKETDRAAAEARKAKFAA